jgi:hypothetical protein
MARLSNPPDRCTTVLQPKLNRNFNNIRVRSFILNGAPVFSDLLVDVSAEGGKVVDAHKEQ